MSSETKTKNKFLAYWTSLGLEAIYDVNKAEKGAAWAKLSGDRFIWPYDIGWLKTQAQVHREDVTEVYFFETDDDISKVMEDFVDNPQPLVDWIRKDGVKVYSSYVPDYQKRIK